MLKLISNPYDVGEVVQKKNFISQDFKTNLGEYSLAILEKELSKKREIVFLCGIESTGRENFYISSFLTIQYSNDGIGVVVTEYEGVPQNGWNKKIKYLVSFNAQIVNLRMEYSFEELFELEGSRFLYECFNHVDAPKDFRGYNGDNSLWASGNRSGGFNMESLCE